MKKTVLLNPPNFFDKKIYKFHWFTEIEKKTFLNKTALAENLLNLFCANLKASTLNFRKTPNVFRSMSHKTKNI